MQLSFQCPVCSQPNYTEVTDHTGELHCQQCQWERTLAESDLVDDRPARCLVCGTEDLWRQKDFPQGLGLLMVATGALLSTIAWAMLWPVTAIGVLMAFGLADLLLYTFMKDVLVCYRCRAKHRRVNFDDDHPRFDLELAERYRQEAIRLENSVQAKP